MVRVLVPSLAKLNLDLRVLHKRPDGYHELRTIFQTISLQDRIAIEYHPSRRAKVTLDSSVDIANNLVLQAAELVFSECGVRGQFRIQLNKKIPMGGGLGGGSSNAAAMLLALPALAGKVIPVGRLADLGIRLGSDVPFFLYGGTALGLGRGTELYPLPDLPREHVVVVAPGVAVSTAKAYADLNRSVTNALTSGGEFPILREFQAITWNLKSVPLSSLPLANDFEKSVLDQHPPIAKVVRGLKRLGADPVRMTGSGSSVFGVFNDGVAAKAAAAHFGPTAFAERFVDRARYQKLWARALDAAFRLCPLSR